ncbi:SRPBCC domain-containing protein [Actinophytocola sediminis]
MTDGTLETIEGRPALRFERTLAHSVERVWRAISTPAELAAWFPAAAEWTPAPGETIEAYGSTGQVTEVDPPHRLAWTFGGERFSFDLAAEEEGCRLVFTHVFDDRTLAAQTAAGWETYLARLEPHLAGDQLSEQDAHADWAEIHERYAERFGVDPGPGRRFIAAQRAVD